MTELNNAELRRAVIEQGEQIARLEERLAASDRALMLSSSNLEAWKASANEWRGALDDQRQEFVTKIEFQVMDGRVSKLETSQLQDTGRSSALGSVWIVAVAVIGMLLAVTGIVLSITLR